MNIEPDPNPECPKCHHRYTVVMRDSSSETSASEKVDPPVWWCRECMYEWPMKAPK